MAWACDEKIGALGRKEGDGNIREKEERVAIKEKGVSEEEVYDRAT